MCECVFSVLAGAREPDRKGRRERPGPRLGEGRDGRRTGALASPVATASWLDPRISAGHEPQSESVAGKNGQGDVSFIVTRLYTRNNRSSFRFSTLDSRSESVAISIEFFNARTKRNLTDSEFRIYYLIRVYVDFD